MIDFNSIPLFDTVPDFTNPVEQVYTFARTFGESPSSVFDQFSKISRPTISFSHTYTPLTLKEAQDLYLFFMSCYGNTGVFRVPSWTNDFYLVDNSYQGDNTIKVGKTDLNYWGLEKNRDAYSPIRGLFLTDGVQVQYVSVVRTDTSNLNYDTLTLSEALEFDLLIDNSCVGFVYFVRLANDFLDFNALGNNYFSVKITFAEQIQFKGPLRSISAEPLTESQIDFPELKVTLLSKAHPVMTESDVGVNVLFAMLPTIMTVYPVSEAIFNIAVDFTVESTALPEFMISTEADLVTDVEFQFSAIEKKFAEPTTWAFLEQNVNFESYQPGVFKSSGFTDGTLEHSITFEFNP